MNLAANGSGRPISSILDSEKIQNTERQPALPEAERPGLSKTWPSRDSVARAVLYFLPRPSLTTESRPSGQEALPTPSRPLQCRAPRRSSRARALLRGTPVHTCPILEPQGRPLGALS